MRLTRARLVEFAGFALIAVLCYLLLVAADFLLQSYTAYVDTQNAAYMKAAQDLERSREAEDARLVDEAKHLGYRSFYYPDLFSKVPRWSALVDAYGVAPLASPPHTRIYYCNEGYGQVRYTSDRYGFRNDDLLWSSPSVDMAIVGDSFVQGACVSNAETIAARLTAAGVPAISLGMGGNSPIHYAATIKTFTQVIRPRQLVVVFYPNDNVEHEDLDVYREVFFASKPAYFSADASDATGKPRLSDRLLALYAAADKLVNAPLTEARPVQPARLRLPPEPRPAAAEQAATTAGDYLALRNLRGAAVAFWQERQRELPYGSKLAIDTAVSECRINACSAIIAYIPNSPTKRPDARAKSYRSMIEAYARGVGIRFVDMTPVLAQLGPGAYAVKGPHLSPQGYRLVAERLAEVAREAQ